MTPLHDWIASCLYSERPDVYKSSEFNLSKFVNWKDIEYCINNPWRYLITLLDKESGDKIPLETTKAFWYGKNIPNKKEVVQCVHDGHTLMLGTYGVHSELTNNFCSIIEEECEVETDMHVFCSLGKSSSFSAHWDYPSNFIMQISGKTHWKVFDHLGIPGEPLKKEKHLGTPIIDVILEPNDVLYIPKMMYHRADPFEKRISISIPCVPGNPMDRSYLEL